MSKDKIVSKITTSIDKNRKTYFVGSFLTLVVLCVVYFAYINPYRIEQQSNDQSVSQSTSQDVQESEKPKEKQEKPKSDSTRTDDETLSDDELDKLLKEQNTKDTNANTNTNTTTQNDDINDTNMSSTDTTQETNNNTTTEDSTSTTDETQPEEITLSPGQPTSSGFSQTKATELMNEFSNKSTNIMDGEVKSDLDKYVEDQCNSGNFNKETLKNNLLNYTHNNKKMVINAEVDVATLNENFTKKDLCDKLSFKCIINYLNIKAYYNVKDKTYTIYYIAATTFKK